MHCAWKGGWKPMQQCITFTVLKSVKAATVDSVMGKPARL